MHVFIFFIIVVGIISELISEILLTWPPDRFAQTPLICHSVFLCTHMELPKTDKMIYLECLNSIYSYRYLKGKHHGFEVMLIFYNIFL